MYFGVIENHSIYLKVTVRIDYVGSLNLKHTLAKRLLLLVGYFLSNLLTC